MLPDGNLVLPGQYRNSCWTEPVDPPILGMYPVSGHGYCYACVIQNATGLEPDADPFYEIWVRDTHNRAVGGIGPVTLAPTAGKIDTKSHSPAHISFLVGGKSLNVWSSLSGKDKKYVKVYMVYDFPAGYKDSPTVFFDTNPDPKTHKPSDAPSAEESCFYSDSTEDGAIILFYCYFICLE